MTTTREGLDRPKAAQAKVALGAYLKDASGPGALRFSAQDSLQRVGDGQRPTSLTLAEFDELMARRRAGDETVMGGNLFLLLSPSDQRVVTDRLMMPEKADLITKIANIAELVGVPLTVNPQPPQVLPIPDEFWDADAILSKIKVAGEAKGVSPAALLLAVLVRVSASAPHTMCLPDIVGVPATASLFACIFGASGDGKGIASRLARTLLPFEDEHDHPLGPVVRTVPAGSGEGVMDKFMERTAKPPIQKYHNGLMVVGEGTLLDALANRAGNTLDKVLCSVWSGEELGTSLSTATGDSSRELKELSINLGCLMALQLANGRSLLGREDLGLPQRFVYALGVAPMADDMDVPIRPLGYLPTDPGRGLYKFAPDLAAAIKEHHKYTSSGLARRAQFDQHATLLKMKVAVNLSLLLGHHGSVGSESWRLAQYVMQHSFDTRALAAKSVSEAEQAKWNATAERRIGEAVKTQSRLAEAEAINAERCSAHVLTILHDEPGITRRELLRRVRSRQAKEQLELLIEDGSVVIRKEHTAAGGNQAARLFLG